MAKPLKYPNWADALGPTVLLRFSVNALDPVACLVMKVLGRQLSQ
jgi:hypothetical protein